MCLHVSQAFFHLTSRSTALTNLIRPRHKSEIKVSIKRKNYGDLPFSSGFSLNLIEIKIWPLTTAFFEILVNFQNCLTFQNYSAKSEIDGLTERKNQLFVFYLRKQLCPAFKKNMALENVQ